jgi:hypothetical protein
MRRLVASVVAGLAVIGATLVRGEEPSKPLAAVDRATAGVIASPDEIVRWVDELGNDAFTVRQAAAAHLLAAGMPARDALLAIVDGPDPEKRAAARRLIALIDQSEFHRRLEAFAADTEGKQNLTLPGWEQFQKLVGNDAGARALFVEMQRQEGPLISATFGGSKRAPSELLESRLVKLVQWQQMGGNRLSSPPVGSRAALLFLGSVPEVEVSDSAASLIEMLLQQPPFLEALRSENREDATRRLAVAWLLNCPSKSDEILRHRLSIISSVNLREGLPLPLAVINGEGPYRRATAMTRAQAALLVGQIGGPEYIGKLEPMLADSANCTQFQQQLPGQPNVTLQVRDAVLVALLQLTGQRPSDYGYLSARMQMPNVYVPGTLARANEQQRVESIAKWHQWRAAQKNAADPPKSN